MLVKRVSLYLIAALFIASNAYADSFSSRQAVINLLKGTIPYSAIKLVSESHYTLNGIVYKNIPFTFDTYNINSSKAQSYTVRCASSEKIDIHVCQRLNKNAAIDDPRYFAYLALFDKSTQDEEKNFFIDTHSKLPDVKPVTSDGRYDVVTYTTYSDYPTYGKYNNKTHEIWVTLTSEMKNKIRSTICHSSYKNSDAITIRFNQMLGLAPDKPYSPQRHFVFMTVPGVNSYEKNGMFRPCVNTYHLNNNPSCTTFLTYQQQMHNNYTKNWVVNNYQSSNQPDNPQPWTGQGYTYDWGSLSTNHYGLSEYIIAKNTELFIYKTQDVKAFVNDICNG